MILSSLCTVSFSLQLGMAYITFSRLHILHIRNTNFIPLPPTVIPEELLHTSVPAWITSRSSKQRRRRRERKQKRGKRAGIHVRLRSSPDQPALPSLFIANAQSIVNKIDKLRLRLHSNRIISCAFFFTETWLNQNIPDAAIDLAGQTVYRADRTADSSKDKGGGVCIYVCNSWCTATDIVETFCSPDLEFITVKCRPLYLPREFTVVFLTAVYIPPQANARLALANLHDAFHRLKNNRPHGVFIIAGDLNHTNLKTAMPTFHQFIDFPTREISWTRPTATLQKVILAGPITSVCI